MKKSLILTCPVCKSTLQREKSQYKCKKNHTFDLAKEQYVNLLLNSSHSTGDDKEMLASRHAFLEKGYYDVIAFQLNKLVKQLLTYEQNYNIMDAGCGEGYYLNKLYTELNDQSLSLYGFDISKRGVQLAAKRNPNITWFVANAFNIPVENNSIDLFISMFAFYSEEEIKRVLKKDGKAIIFRAGKNHLLELKSILYNELSLKESNLDLSEDQFIIDKQNYKTSIQINTYEDLEQLLHMTPHYWKTKQENKALLKNYSSLDCSIDLDIYTVMKK